jgi:NAD(P)-dependent dehydrogenase (short-subunit alcohol dehydrogenase family)
MRLSGKMAVVTGGSRGIGRAIALAFAREGADLVIGSLDDAYLSQVIDEVRSHGRRALGLPIDVGKVEDCVRLIDQAVGFLGRIDILVNNAGGGGYAGPLHTLPHHAWDHASAINLRAPAICATEAIPHMLRQGGGAILNITSTRGLSGRRNYSPYSSTKAALNQLTRCMALDYAEQNIRVNAIAPGAIATERSLEVLALLEDHEALEHRLAEAGPTERARLIRLRDNPQARREQIMGRAPMGRPGTPEEIAAAALFLVSDEASYITGHILAVDGGRAAGG